ncbi:hypothetical protein COCOR_02784 [Corallococcus coralloides DSM 2259]|uniref:Uncharacterized protein n=1 Tax=Corallococcus coralloides (strain ATCC 25202 / DSM 2259 / NBRC 100086 / M2) TaxID=1144275 RepID=H8MVL9_CORCM|nr:hypothetical protein [Corallococcus coralloides]AFE04816.1 hypothetical protein COCOR_02784 [Corallococcus coralloides DSM 2259]
MLGSALLASVIVAQAPVSPASRAAEELGLGPVLDSVVHQGVSYVALGRGGIAVLKLDGAAPQLVRRIEEGRRFVRLVVVGQSLLAIEQREEAHAFSLATPEQPQPDSLASALGAARDLTVVTQAPPPPQAPPPTAVPSSTRLTVTAVHDGDVTLSGGALAGLGEGTRVRVRTQDSREVVLKVIESREDTAIARLGRGENVRVGDTAVVTDAPATARLFFPETGLPRLRYGFHARPFLALDARTESGKSARAGGLLLDAFIAWRPGNLPLVLSAQLDPVGFGLGTGLRHTPGSAYVAAAYSTDFLEVGIGAGALFGQKECSTQFDYDPNTYEQINPRTVCDSNAGVSFQQVLRLGALDGFHLAWNSAILSRDNQFRFGSGRGEVQVPLTPSLSLFGAGGGSASGWNFGELGVRSFIKGTGGSGTTVLSASLGIVSLSDGTGEALTGPSIAIGIERRP